jgi:galactokinase
MILIPLKGPLRSLSAIAGSCPVRSATVKLGAMPKARAPGRVTLIGDHTDYNDGLSLPMAIDLATEVSFTPKPNSFLVGIDSDQFPNQPLEIPLGVATALVPPQARLAAGLLRQWPPPSGGRVRVTSTVPVGAGLSSSAAFAVAFLLALGHPADPLMLARGCQEAERAAGAHVGLLDPIAIAAATPGHALHIDFATLATRPVALPDEAAFVIVHSEAPRLLTDSPYATRRAECDAAANVLGHPLGLCELGDLSQLGDPILRRRARHVVTECARVREVERRLARGDLSGVGSVMTEGHRSLAGDYKVSLPVVDDLVDHLLTQPGVLGARMSGGGFGGCVVALCRPDSPVLDPEAHAPRRAWVVRPSAGATLLAR